MIKLLTKKALSLAGLQIVKTPHKGIDICQDIRDFLPSLEVSIIFDVGANIGQSAQVYRFWFPNSKIYCFEPSHRNFSSLKKTIGNINNTYPYNIALGSKTGVGMISEKKDLGVMDKLVPMEILDDIGDNRDSIVQVDTIDKFCENNSLPRISYLKIDTEGHDLEVLKGAKRMLQEESIDIIEVEVGMNPKNNWHIPYGKVQDFLEGYRYFPFGFYDQVHEWPTNTNILRRANVVFIANKISNMSKNSKLSSRSDEARYPTDK